MNKLKIMTVVGTRPEIIRLSATIKLLDKYTNQVFVHTGQNYDYELNEIFFEDLGLRKPDHFMNVSRESLGAAIGDIFKKTEEILDVEKPDALLVLGDTNSCLSAYMAKRKHIPIFHMEAGNRSFDFNVPEEINRRVIDHIADFNLVYTEHARRHLLSEGLQHHRIYLTGSPMFEVLNQHMDKINKSDVLDRLNEQLIGSQSNTELNTEEHREIKENTQSNTVSNTVQHCEPKKYFLVSVHREENVDNQENLKKIILILNNLSEKYGLPVIVSTHPRTRKRIENLRSSAQSASSAFYLNDLIHFMKPFGFLDYISLQKHAICTISDSGTISEESSMLQFPAISLRQSMERPEAQDSGSIILTGFEPEVVLNAIETVIDEHKFYAEQSRSAPITPALSLVEGSHQSPAEYQIENTSWRVVKLILGNTKLSNKWWGVKKY
ncbi:MAG: UDP-N-acetyl glucosamine 2-epimerase [Bacteroidales bacterium]|jgi:UDP-N-acetylglucosamine 2-epimerase|nr:UDP-N-acetyl glucosamine 2-epimerase [Bacteroidales bacterium]